MACVGAAFGNIFSVIDGVTDIVSLEAFANSACTISASRVVFCWGDNARGQLGTAPETVRFSWSRGVRVTGLSDAVTLGGSYDSPCAATSAGAVYCCGFNANREAGQPLARVPRLVTGGLTFRGT